MRRVLGNDACADCGAADPDWASLNLGILLCIECSGVHRNMSVQISKVSTMLLCMSHVNLKSNDTVGCLLVEFSIVSLFQYSFIFKYVNMSISPNSIRGML